jgi:HSP20 family molecular chaperone IbpA
MNQATIAICRPGLLGRSVFDDVFDSILTDFPTHLRQSTQGYPVADIYRDTTGNTVLEIALAGFAKDQLSIDILSDEGSITVSADHCTDDASAGRRIARRSFKKTYVDFDRNLDLSAVSAQFENGLLTVTVPQRPEVQPLKVMIS